MAARMDDAEASRDRDAVPSADLAYGAPAGVAGADSRMTDPAGEFAGAGEPSQRASQPEGEERRGRSRDRYGRDRRERAPRESRPADPAEMQAMPQGPSGDTGGFQEPVSPGFEAEVMSAVAPAAEANATAPMPQEPEAPSVPTAATAGVRDMQRTPAAPRPLPAEASVAAASASMASVAAPSAAGLPKVTPFQLPLDELERIAESSGLQWVNSDAERIANAQAAMAAEPKPVHVPRERPPAVAIDEGKLILVETKRDLADVVLPFEQSTGSADATRTAT
ncbi:MAG: hypothetical protein EOO24_08510 [Comamonadaceae bacterium]|nr:MAG: hypothetical protein EOO24_08510 [Comamonadaceae bacterium]